MILMGILTCYRRVGWQSPEVSTFVLRYVGLASETVFALVDVALS